MRRKPGRLVPLEMAICACAVDLRRGGIDEFHGYAIARHLGELGNRKLLTAYGTLYRALARLESMGLLLSRWEAPEIPARENRPGRRLYTLTPSGELIVRDAQRVAPHPPAALRRRPATA